MLVVKAAVAARLPLFVDEAFYWQEGRHLAAAYSDLPGMTAWLARLGVETLLPPQESSCVLQAFRLPSGMSYARLHDGLKARGFVIYAGQGKLAAGIFRISAMGAISAADLQRLQDALEAELGR